MSACAYTHLFNTPCCACTWRTLWPLTARPLPPCGRCPELLAACDGWLAPIAAQARSAVQGAPAGGSVGVTAGPAVHTALTLVAAIERGLPPGEGAALLEAAALPAVAIAARAAAEARGSLLAVPPPSARRALQAGPATL